eukprot:613385-Karenia_brevis.AAC.1
MEKNGDRTDVEAIRPLGEVWIGEERVAKWKDGSMRLRGEALELKPREDAYQEKESTVHGDEYKEEESHQQQDQYQDEDGHEGQYQTKEGYDNDGNKDISGGAGNGGGGANCEEIGSQGSAWQSRFICVLKNVRSFSRHERFEELLEEARHIEWD